MIVATVDGAPRHAYYNPVLDQHCQAKMTAEMLAAVLADTYADGGPLNEPDNEGHEYNLVSSLCEDGLHRPALDIDVPCVLVESSTPGHCHLYFPTITLDQGAYFALLSALGAAGILDAKYVEHSVARGQTLLRPPGQRKAMR